MRGTRFEGVADLPVAVQQAIAEIPLNSFLECFLYWVKRVWITRDTILRVHGIVLCANELANGFFILVRRVARSDVAMTSFKMTSLNLNKFKYQISKLHKFILILYKNYVICIKIVEIMALFRVFLDHPS